VVVHETAVIELAVAQPQKFVGAGVAVIDDEEPEVPLLAEVMAFVIPVLFHPLIVA
jgi:hypothetical protein